MKLMSPHSSSRDGQGSRSSFSSRDSAAAKPRVASAATPDAQSLMSLCWTMETSLWMGAVKEDVHANTDKGARTSGGGGSEITGTDGRQWTVDILALCNTTMTIGTHMHAMQII